MNGGIIFLIVLIFLVIGGYGGWVLWSRIQANRLGLPPPSLNPFTRSTSSDAFPAPARGGLRGWIDNQIRKFKNRNNRYATGAYESSSYESRGRGGAGHRLDPDEAWDTRVGNEAHYEEQELGLHAPQGQDTRYGHAAYGAPSAGFVAAEPERGRSRTREYDDGLRADDASARNPFRDENAAASLRGVSPRPVDHEDTSYGGASAQSQGHRKSGSDGSPTGRRSELYRG
jgi:hypothetical protein